MTSQVGAGPGDESLYHLWHAPGKAVLVYISRDAARVMLDRNRRVETGGILLGRADESGDGFVVTIDDSVEVPSEHLFGSSYTLSETDTETLRATFAACTRERAPLYPVGFYRTNDRKGFGLSEEDVKLFTSLFPDAANVALLLKRRRFRADLAAFFIWENGIIRSESSYLELPLRGGRRKKTAPAPPRLQEALQARTPAGLDAVLRGGGRPPREEARALLDASIRTSSERVAEQEAPITALGAALRTPAAPPPPQMPAASSAAALPSFSSIAGPDLLPDRTLSEPDPEPAAPVFAATAVAQHRRPFWFSLWTPVIAALLVGDGFLGYYCAQRWHEYTAPVEAARRDPYALSLVVVEYGENLQVTWDHKSRPIEKGDRATLIITDGEQTRSVELSAKQLKSGAVTYRRVTGQVSFRLEVAVNNGRIVAETWDSKTKPFQGNRPGQEEAGDDVRSHAKPSGARRP